MAMELNCGGMTKAITPKAIIKPCFAPATHSLLDVEFTAFD